jgi:M6 family metalloprotease-like protein
MKKYLAFTLAFVFLIPTAALAAPKAGTSCSKIGLTSIYAGKKYACVKSGKKLVWNKGVVIPTPKPTATPTPTPTAIGDPEGAIGSTPTPTPTPTRTIDPTKAVQGQTCLRNSGDVVGYNDAKVLVVLMCNQFDDRYAPRLNGEVVDQDTGRIKPGLMGSMTQTLEYKSQSTIAQQPKSTITNASELAPVTQCKIPDAGPYGDIANNPQKHFVSGFPIYPERAVLAANPTIQVIAIDFLDLQASNSPAVDLKETTTFVSEFFQRQSTKAIQLNWAIPEKYFRMPKTIAEYDLGGDIFKGGFSPDKAFSYVREAIKQVEQSIDFSPASIIAVVVPPQVTRKQIGTFVAQAGEPSQQFVTNEKNIFNVLIMGGPAGNKSYELLNWTHETGHMFGLTDVRDVTDPTKQDSSDLGVFDLMNSMIAPELLAWQRFILGILDDSQVRCVVGATTTTHVLAPVERITIEPKMVVIPISKYKAIIVESRRNLGYDTTLGSLNEGVIVYTLDTTIGYRKSPLKIVPSPSATDATWRRDAALKINESVIIWGYKITNIETGDFGDVAKIEKIG